MKRLVLLFAGLLIGLTTSATELNTNNPDKHFKKNKNYRNAQPVVFVEQDVTFFVFPDGSFDLKTNKRNTFYNTNTYRRTNFNKKRSSISISHDRFGNIKRIGNIFLNYSRYGKIKRVGSVKINYKHSNGILKQVGGLHVFYNHKGKIVKTKGHINRFNMYNKGKIAYLNNDRHANDSDYYFKQKRNKK